MQQVYSQSTDKYKAVRLQRCLRLFQQAKTNEAEIAVTYQLAQLPTMPGCGAYQDVRPSLGLPGRRQDVRPSLGLHTSTEAALFLSATADTGTFTPS